MKITDKHIGHLLALFCALVWGATFVASKQLLAHYSPVQLMFMRFVIAYGTLWLLHPKWIRPAWKEELLYFFMGLTGCSLYFWTENTALTITYAANVSTIVAAAPIFTAILAHFFTGGRERLSRWIWIGFILAMLGVVLVVFNGAFVLHLNPLGDLLALATAAVWSVFTILQGKALERRGSLFITRKVMFYGILTSLPLLLREGLADFSLAPAFSSGINLFCLLFLAVVGSALCYVAWCSAERKLGLVTTSNYIYTIPFITLVTSALCLEESVSPIGVLGAVLIVLGVWVSGRKKPEN